MATSRIRTATHAVLTACAMPWSVFVAVFLYYAGLTLVAVSGASLPDSAVIIAYSVPVMGYALLLVARALQALAAVPVTIGTLVAPRLQ